MPKLPTDMKKAHAAAVKSRGLLARRAKEAAENETKTADALEGMRLDFAKQQGVDPSEVTMIVCRRGGR